MKRALCMMLLIALALSGCGGPKKYTASWYDVFDTVVTLTGYAGSQSAFDRTAEQAHAELQRLHAIFDRYHPHEGVRGAYAANHGERDLEPELVELLALCDSLFERTARRVDPRMGALLATWHDYRERGTELPPADVLERAAADRSQLDLGAVAKGWAVERVAHLIEPDMPSYLIDAGGNIRVGAPPLDGRHWWSVGVQNPEGGGIVARLAVANLSVVSSGGYQRYYDVDGVRYHHIIDPDTRMPGGECLQVTILTEDSGLADYLSTAVYLLPREAGRALVESLDGVEAIWVLDNGVVEATDGAIVRMTDGV